MNEQEQLLTQFFNIQMEIDKTQEQLTMLSKIKSELHQKVMQLASQTTTVDSVEIPISEDS